MSPTYNKSSCVHRTSWYIIKYSASYLQGPGVDSHHRSKITWGFSWFFLVPPGRYMDIVVKLARASVFYILPISKLFLHLILCNLCGSESVVIRVETEVSLLYYFFLVLAKTISSVACISDNSLLPNIITVTKCRHCCWCRQECWSAWIPYYLGT